MSASRQLWIDGSAGASGDMILGALVDLGVPLASLRRALGGLALSGFTLRSRSVERCGLAARKIDVRVRGDEPARDWRDIRRIISRSRLDPAVRRRALAVFRRLIEAEAEVHGSPVERAHLHEAGATDAIVDVVGACHALEALGVGRVRVSPLTTGFGSVVCRHGRYPVPGPATLLLVRGVPIRGGEIEAERLTPTGAALLTTWADEWGPLPAFRPTRVGCGAGERDLAGEPNCLRAVLGENLPATVAAAHEIAVIEATLDDCTPQALAWTADRLRQEGALDVFTSAVNMKKGRVGHNVTVLAEPLDAGALAETLLRESTTFGVRMRREQRVELARGHRRVRTPYGAVRVKLGQLGGETLQAWPEFDDCAMLAARKSVPLREVQQAALAAWRRAGSQRPLPKKKNRSGGAD